MRCAGVGHRPDVLAQLQDTPHPARTRRFSPRSTGDGNGIHPPTVTASSDYAGVAVPGDAEASPRADFVTIAQVADRWSVQPSTVRKWISRGLVPGTTAPMPYVRMGGRVGFTAAQLHFIEGRMTRGQQRPAP